MKRNFRYITKFEEETRSAQLETRGEDNKTFYQQDNIGKAKYTISFHDGVQKHKDGSPFYQLYTFKNKVDLLAFRKKLLAKGYSEERSLKRSSSTELETREAFNPIHYEYGVFQVKKQGGNQTDENGEPLEIGWYFRFRKGRTKDSDTNISEVFSSKSEATNALNKEIEVERNKWEATEGRSSFAQLEQRNTKKMVITSYLENIGVHYDNDEVNIINDKLATTKVVVKISTNFLFEIPVGLPCVPATNLPQRGWWLDHTAPKVKAFVALKTKKRSSSAQLEQRNTKKMLTGKLDNKLDRIGARELYLFADNEPKLQNQQKSIITNLARKFAKGVYNKDLAIKLWTYLADSASKLYGTFLFGEGSMGNIFTPATRRETARMLEELHFSSVQDEAIDYKK